MLDNLEQVAAPPADLGELLRRAGRIRILATSRAPLRIAGEQEYPVPGLPAPARPRPPRRRSSASSCRPRIRAREPEALAGVRVGPPVRRRGRLGQARASRSPAPTPATSPRSSPTSAACRSPSSWPPRGSGSSRRRRSTSGSRAGSTCRAAGAADVPERQRSLRGAIDVEPRPARRARLPPVRAAGRCSWAASTCRAPRRSPARPRTSATDVLDGLASLVDQSLVRSGEVGGEPRFSMLEPIREYALERLEARGEHATPSASATRARTSRSPRSWQPDAQRRRPARGARPARAASTRTCAPPSTGRTRTPTPRSRLGIAIAVWRMWQKRGYLREARIRVGGADRAPVVRRRAAASCAPRPTRSWAGSSTGTARSTAPAPTTRRPSRSGARSATGARSRTPATTCRSCTRWASIPELPPDAGEQAAALLGRGARDLPSAGRRARRGQRVLGHRHPALLRARRRPGGGGVRVGAGACTAGSATGPRRRGRCTSSGSARLQARRDRRRTRAAGRGPAAVHVGRRRRRRHARARRPGRGRRGATATSSARPGCRASPGGSRPRRAPASRASWRTRSSWRPSRNAASVMSPEDLARYQAEGAALPIDDGVRYALGEVEFEDAARTLRGAGVTGSLPEGVVTFLFTDIEGSTRLLTDIGDAAYGELLERTGRSCPRPPRPQGGVPFGSEGDARLRRVPVRRRRRSAPPSPPSGRSPPIRGTAATSGCGWASTPARSRSSRGDYVGIEVHRAARVAAAAHGGQVLVSDATRVARGRARAPGSACRDLGEHRLKDFARAERLFQVEARRASRPRFPPLRDARPDAQQPAAPAHHVRRAGRGRRRGRRCWTGRGC